jgi:hypothetical protein
MKQTFVTKSGRTYIVSDNYPQLTQEEGKRRQQEAVMCVVKILREKAVAQGRDSSDNFGSMR